MRSTDTFDLDRVKRYIDSNPECDVIIISNNKTLSEEYWKRIRGHLGIKKRPFIVTNSHTWDGLPMGSLVLKIGRWWENRNAIEFMKHVRLAKLILPITFIPPYPERK